MFPDQENRSNRSQWVEEQATESSCSMLKHCFDDPENDNEDNDNNSHDTLYTPSPRAMANKWKDQSA